MRQAAVAGITHVVCCAVVLLALPTSGWAQGPGSVEVAGGYSFLRDTLVDDDRIVDRAVGQIRPVVGHPDPPVSCLLSPDSLVVRVINPATRTEGAEIDAAHGPPWREEGAYRQYSTVGRDASAASVRHRNYERDH